MFATQRIELKLFVYSDGVNATENFFPTNLNAINYTKYNYCGISER